MIKRAGPAACVGAERWSLLFTLQHLNATQRLFVISQAANIRVVLANLAKDEWRAVELIIR